MTNHEPKWDEETETWDEESMKKVRAGEWTLMFGRALIKQAPPKPLDDIWNAPDGDDAFGKMLTKLREPVQRCLCNARKDKNEEGSI